MIIDQRPQKRKLAQIKSRLNSVKNVAKSSQKEVQQGKMEAEIMLGFTCNREQKCAHKLTPMSN